jgi:hypothetical protein
MEYYCAWKSLLLRKVNLREKKNHPDSVFDRHQGLGRFKIINNVLFKKKTNKQTTTTTKNDGLFIISY